MRKLEGKEQKHFHHKHLRYSHDPQNVTEGIIGKEIKHSAMLGMNTYLENNC
jgi:hypothetical protein